MTSTLNGNVRSSLTRFLLGVAFTLGLVGCRITNPSTSDQIIGVVEDDHGQPVANAIVECYRYSYVPMRPVELELKQRTRTDDRGTYRFSASDDNLVVLARKDGSALVWSMFPNFPNRRNLGRLRLGATGSIAGELKDETGAPVADAEVWVFQAMLVIPPGEGRVGGGFLCGQAARQLFSARTTADGRFQIKGLPRDAAVDLAVRKPGKALREPVFNPNHTDPLQFSVGQEEIKLVMEPGGVIEGKVVEPNTTRPIAGVKLWLQCRASVFSADEGREPVISGSDGTFRMTDVPAASFQVIAGFGGAYATPDWIAPPVNVVVKVGETVRDVTIAADKGGILELKAIDSQSHAPLTGTYFSVDQISVDHRFYRAGVSSGNAGTAQLRLPPGDYRVTSVKRLWSAGLDHAKVEEGQTNRLQFEMTPPVVIKGIVRDPSGAPAANIRVSFCPDAGSDGQTDAAGRFEITWNPRPTGSISPGSQYCLIARDWRRNLAVARDVDEADADKSFDLELQPALTIVGQVKDESGKPISNAPITAALRSRNTLSDLDHQLVLTDSQGRYELAPLPPGRGYSILVEAKTYEWTSQIVEPDNAQPRRVELPAFILKQRVRR